MSEPPRDPRADWMKRKHSQQRDTPFADLLAGTPRCSAAGEHGHERAVVIVATPGGAPITTEDDAAEVVRALYRSRPRQGSRYLLSIPKPEILELDSGGYEVRACIHDKAAGNATVDGRRGRGEQLAYDRTNIPKMRELRRLAKHAADSQVAEEVRERAELEARRWGERWEDIRNWDVDHALAAPRTDRERADRARSVEAGQHIPLEQRKRARARTDLPWEERAPAHRPVTKTGKAASQTRTYVQLVRDRLEASRVQDEQLRQLLTGYSNRKRGA
jgi:hypothetical protein